jgi:hypothetical protein
LHQLSRRRAKALGIVAAADDIIVGKYADHNAEWAALRD